VTNITFIFETSPNTKPKEKKVWGHGMLYTSNWKSGGHITRVPHQNAPMPEIWHVQWRILQSWKVESLDQGCHKVQQCIPSISLLYLTPQKAFHRFYLLNILTAYCKFSCRWSLLFSYVLPWNLSWIIVLFQRTSFSKILHAFEYIFVW